MAQYKQFIKMDDLVGTGDIKFCRYLYYDQLERFKKYMEGSLKEIIPKDFGNITKLLEGTLLLHSADMSIQKIIIPEGVVTIPDNTLAFTLTSDHYMTIVFPSSLTTTGPVCPMNSSGTIIYDFSKATKIPTLTSTASNLAFGGALEIRVPSALYSSWKSATNWSSLTSINKLVAV